MARRVHIVGDPETYEVLCETETTKILVNTDARARRDIAQLEAQIKELRTQLAARTIPHADVTGAAIDGP